MAKNNKINMPSGTSGLMRYFDDDHSSKIKLKPGHIVIICIFVMILLLLLSFFGGGLLN